MPSDSHEVLVAKLREQPPLLASLVHVMTGRTLAPGLAPVDSTVRFVNTAEVRPDILLAEEKRWAIVEVQNECDQDKQRRWLLAAGVLLDQTGTLGDVIVITPHRYVAKWARTVAHLVTPLGTKLELTPVVLHVGPEVLGRLLSAGQPELALVAVWAMSHRTGPAAKRVVVRAFKVSRKLPEPLQKPQKDAILKLVSKPVYDWVMKMHANRNKNLTPDERDFVEDLKALLAPEARKDGLAKGKAEGKAEAVLMVLAARGFSVTADERDTIERCADPVTLARWLAKVATAGSVREVLGAEHRASAAKRSKRTTRATKRRPVTA